MKTDFPHVAREFSHVVFTLSHCKNTKKTLLSEKNIVLLQKYNEKEMSERRVRVRFAPSPTGPLHIGGVRTALYNYLFARQHGGDMVFRIEDTDSTRFVPGAEEYIIEAFKWLGIEFDEGVSYGGNYGPYRQSERRDIYQKYVQQLLDAGKAYYAFDTPEELEAKRGEVENFQYDASTRLTMRNSLTLPAAQVQQMIADGEQYVVRFLVEPGRDVVVHDLIRGDVSINSSILDDKVLFKSADQLPTYHLANIVDDHLMDISHVIRGEEWLPSAPLHVLLYEAFGWTDTMPRFAHLPLLLKPVGNGKLSKRDGDRLGFPVFPLEWHDPKSGEVSSGYREKGYLPEAVVPLASVCAKIRYGYSYDMMRPIDSLTENEIPILFIHGEEDSFILPEHSERMQKETKGYSELHLIPGAAHAASILTAPAEYKGIVAAFLEHILDS